MQILVSKMFNNAAKCDVLIKNFIFICQFRLFFVLLHANCV